MFELNVIYLLKQWIHLHFSLLGCLPCPHFLNPCIHTSLTHADKSLSSLFLSFLSGAYCGGWCLKCSSSRQWWWCVPRGEMPPLICHWCYAPRQPLAALISQSILHLLSRWKGPDCYLPSFPCWLHWMWKIRCSIQSWSKPYGPYLSSWRSALGQRGG